jgi:hypothetical protein
MENERQNPELTPVRTNGSRPKIDKPLTARQEYSDVDKGGVSMFSEHTVILRGGTSQGSSAIIRHSEDSGSIQRHSVGVESDSSLASEFLRSEESRKS